MQPAWFLLLNEQQRHGVTSTGAATTGRIGLTIPFLLGATRPLSGSNPGAAANRSDLQSLLESMRDSDHGRRVVIGECANMYQPRVGLTDGAPGGDAVIRADGSTSNLFAWAQYFANNARTVESLADELWNLHGADISAGRFSYRTDGWRAFDPAEVEFIKRALRDPDDDT